MEMENTPMKQFQFGFDNTPNRTLKQRGTMGGQPELYRSKDTPEMFRIEGLFSQYQNSNSKGNTQMTPVQMSQENLFKMKGINARQTPEVYNNRKNSVMTELINSVAIDSKKAQVKTLGQGALSQNFYIPQENYKKKANLRTHEDRKIQEEQFDENKSFNSAFEVNPNQNVRRQRDTRQEMGGGGFQRTTGNSMYSPRNLKMFQSPIQTKVPKGETVDMILDCKDFFERSYSKILQSQKKKAEPEQWDWEGESDVNSKFMIQSFLNSNGKSSFARNSKTGKREQVSTFKLAKKKMSFSNNDKKGPNLLSIPSRIGPDMSKLNLTLSPSNLASQDVLFKNSLAGDAVDQKGLADIILHAKNGLEQNLLSSPTLQKTAGLNSEDAMAFLTRPDSSGFFFQGSKNNRSNHLGDLFKKIEPGGMEGDLKRNKYMVEEIKEALDSNSQALLSNFQGSLSSLSNKKFLQFSNSEKNKKKKLIEKKSNSGHKKKRRKNMQKRNKSSSIGPNSSEKPQKKGVLFGNSGNQRNLQLQNSLVPLEKTNQLFSGVSNLDAKERVKMEGLVSPFMSSLSPFLSAKQLPSTAQKTISHMSKIQSKNGDQVRIGHFTPVTLNCQPKQPKVASHKFDGKIGKFGKFEALTQNFTCINKRMKTPDPVARKLGKRGGSDAKKCQTPSSFLGSDGKNKKKIRNM